LLSPANYKLSKGLEAITIIVEQCLIFSFEIKFANKSWHIISSDIYKQKFNRIKSILIWIVLSSIHVLLTLLISEKSVCITVDDIFVVNNFIDLADIQILRKIIFFSSYTDLFWKLEPF